MGLYKKRPCIFSWLGNSKERKELIHMARENKTTNDTNGESMEQKKFRDQVKEENSVLQQDKKLGGPNRPSE